VGPLCAGSEAATSSSPENWTKRVSRRGGFIAEGANATAARQGYFRSSNLCVAIW
jgi:hypothetical protein